MYEWSKRAGISAGLALENMMSVGRNLRWVLWCVCRKRRSVGENRRSTMGLEERSLASSGAAGASKGQTRGSRADLAQEHTGRSRQVVRKPSDALIRLVRKTRQPGLRSETTASLQITPLRRMRIQQDYRSSPADVLTALAMKRMLAALAG